MASSAPPAAKPQAVYGCTKCVLETGSMPLAQADYDICTVSCPPHLLGPFCRQAKAVLWEGEVCIGTQSPECLFAYPQARQIASVAIHLHTPSMPQPCKSLSQRCMTVLSLDTLNVLCSPDCSTPAPVRLSARCRQEAPITSSL